MVALRTADPHRAVVSDASGTERSLRLTWHSIEERFTLTVWDGRRCVAAIQVAPDDAADLMVVLAEGLADALPGWALADDA